MAEARPKDYPKLKQYTPTRFMLPTSHYDRAKADRAVKFIENLRHTKGKWAGTRFWHCWRSSGRQRSWYARQTKFRKT